MTQLRETQKEKAINDEDVGTEFVKKAFAEPPPPQMMASQMMGYMDDYGLEDYGPEIHMPM